MSGWSFAASGLAKAEDVIAMLERGLRALQGLPGLSAVSTALRTGPDGWTAEASGQGDGPNEHALAYNHLKALISGPDPQTGSSEFNGPHLADTNFHDPRAPGVPLLTAPANPAGGAPDGGQ